MCPTRRASASSTLQNRWDIISAPSTPVIPSSLIIRDYVRDCLDFIVGDAVAQWLACWTPGSSPGLSHCVVFLGKTLYSHSASPPPGSINGYRRQNAGGYLRWTSIPSRGSSNTPSRHHATETGISSGSVGQSSWPECGFTIFYLDFIVSWATRMSCFSNPIQNHIQRMVKGIFENLELSSFFSLQCEITFILRETRSAK